MGIRASDLPNAPAVTADDTFVMSDSPGSNATTRKATALQIKDYVGSQLTGRISQNVRFEQDVFVGDTRLTFYPQQNGASPFQKISFNFDESGSANPDFTFMQVAGRIWFCDLDHIGDENGAVIVSSGHPGASDTFGWTYSDAFAVTKSDLDPATATPAQCAERINALIKALSRIGVNEGHGLLRT